LTNLLSNAIKYSPKGGCVTVTTSECGPQRIRFSIKDEGPGIAANQLHKLFGLFQQLDSSDTRQKGGTGLGLAISKAIVEQHGGKIGVDTAPGAGSTFWFELPVSRMVQTSSESNEKLRYRALLVEDDQNLTLYLKFLLAEHGFAVSQSGTLAEARKLLTEETPPDIILLDIQLPDGNGLEIFETLHGLEKIPVVVVSGTEPGDGDTANVFEWIKKPFTEHQLVAALRLCMRDRGLGAAQVLIIEDDRATRELLKTQLEGLGVECLEAADGETGLAMLRSADPDLIILDVGIPAPDGFAIVDQLKSEGRETSPMIIYTAKDLSNQEKTRLRLGLTAYMTKSQTSETQFMQVVKDLLNGLITNAPANTEEGER
jgi:DNA-binding response OmpR family regulator